MNIKRQYHSSNCTLSVAGLTQEMEGETVSYGGPTLAILLSAEFHLITSGKILSGGKVFFDNLAHAVNSYTQQFLSGIIHPYQVNSSSDLITLEPVHHYHHLIWEKSGDNSTEKQELDLTTVQLFDLVETIDQFYQDPHTLPDFTLPLEPASRRYRPNSLISTMAIPAGIGLTGLALAGVAFFWMPIPEVNRPGVAEPVNIPTETLPSPEVPENDKDE